MSNGTQSCHIRLSMNTDPPFDGDLCNVGTKNRMTNSGLKIASIVTRQFLSNF